MWFYSIKFCGGLLKYFKSILFVAWMGSIFRMGMNVLKWKVRITPTVPKNLGGLLCRYHSVSNVLSGIWTFTFHTLGWLLALPRERARTRPQLLSRGDDTRRRNLGNYFCSQKLLRQLCGKIQHPTLNCLGIRCGFQNLRKFPNSWFFMKFLKGKKSPKLFQVKKKYFSWKRKIVFFQLLRHLAIASSKGGFKRNLVKVQWTTRMVELKWKRIGKLCSAHNGKLINLWDERSSASAVTQFCVTRTLACPC